MTAERKFRLPWPLEFFIHYIDAFWFFIPSLAVYINHMSRTRRYQKEKMKRKNDE